MNPPKNRPASAATPRVLSEPLRVVNLGVDLFAENLRADGVPVVAVQWRPPAGGQPRLAALLARLEDA